MKKTETPAVEEETKLGNKNWKTIQDEFGTQVLFWDEYSFLGKKYRMEEIDTATELALVDLFISSDIKELQSMNDLLKINPISLLASLIAKNTIFQAMALILKRVEPDGRLAPTTPEEFKKGKARLFHPFIKEVLVDFFYLNSELLAPIIQLGKMSGSVGQDKS